GVSSEFNHGIGAIGVSINVIIGVYRSLSEFSRHHDVSSRFIFRLRTRSESVVTLIRVELAEGPPPDPPPLVPTDPTLFLADTLGLDLEGEEAEASSESMVLS